MMAWSPLVLMGSSFESRLQYISPTFVSIAPRTLSTPKTDVLSVFPSLSISEAGDLRCLHAVNNNTHEQRNVLTSFDAHRHISTLGDELSSSLLIVRQCKVLSPGAYEESCQETSGGANSIVSLTI
jgi:hypothetical protein